MSPTLRAWLQLFRVPNLFTVPGDPLAGFLIATGGWLDWRVVPAILASLCFYAAGLAMNDIADLAEDRAERPNRPLPSGAISPNSARWAILALTVLGLGILWGFTTPKTAMLGGGIVVSVVLYDFLTKKVPVLGAMNMGACRSLSVLLGGFAAGAENMGNDPVTAIRIAALIGAAVAVGIYISGVTQLAKFETENRVSTWIRFLPLGALLTGYVIVKQFTHQVFLDSAAALWLLALFMGMGITGQLLRKPPLPIPPRIGAFIRLLLILQAALAVLPSMPAGQLPKSLHSLAIAGILLFLFPISSAVSRRFYAS